GAGTEENERRPALGPIPPNPSAESFRLAVAAERCSKGGPVSLSSTKVCFLRLRRPGESLLFIDSSSKGWLTTYHVPVAWGRGCAMTPRRFGSGTSRSTKLVGGHWAKPRLSSNDSRWMATSSTSQAT